jgi:hypothetical protein
VVFIGLTSEGSDALPSTEAFIADTGVKWPVGYGAGETFAALNVTALPTKFVFGSDGKLVWQGHAGDMASVIQSAL